MPDYTSNITLADAARTLRDARRVVVTTHAKPDGDAFGSVIALSAALRAMGKDVFAAFIPPVPASFRALRDADSARTLAPDDKLPESDLLVILDTGAWAQLAPLRPQLEPRLPGALILDHHLTGDTPAAKRWIDTSAASCCEVVADVLMHPELTGGNPDKLLTPTVAESLFTGIAADTGWFRFSNTRPHTHELAARLLKLGVDHAALYAKMEQTERLEKLMLMVRALGSLKLLAGGRAAMMVLRARDFAETGALVEETERFVDVPQAVASVELVVLITEPPREPGAKPAPIRMSFRSKPGPNAIDVTQLAGEFGGGGHARAAGAKADAPLDEVVQRVERLLTGRLGA
jgi:bifunctional oligoribonuclease and PAP phosphatase NrnA